MRRRVACVSSIDFGFGTCDRTCFSSGVVKEKGNPAMGIVRSIARTNALISLFIVSVCVGIASWGFMSALVPQGESLLNQMADKYDAYFPEITIKDGHASIRLEQPYRIESCRIRTRSS